tara:strand:+ start:2299 stop:2541 length:243 start_codon:yes stop_codon:yes gene_type:complete
MAGSTAASAALQRSVSAAGVSDGAEQQAPLAGGVWVVMDVSDACVGAMMQGYRTTAGLSTDWTMHRRFTPAGAPEPGAER